MNLTDRTKKIAMIKLILLSLIIYPQILCATDEQNNFYLEKSKGNNSAKITMVGSGKVLREIISAADIYIEGFTFSEMAAVAKKLGFTKIIIERDQRVIHVGYLSARNNNQN
jgi:hypothetical protein